MSDSWTLIGLDLLNALLMPPINGEGVRLGGLIVQRWCNLSLLTAGINAPRDSGPQHHLGMSVNKRSNLRRGDLVFWKGHVGIMQDHKRMLHCNAYHMAVTSEPIRRSANRRIAKIAGPITAFRRVSCNSLFSSLVFWQRHNKPNDGNTISELSQRTIPNRHQDHQLRPLMMQPAFLANCSN